MLVAGLLLAGLLAFNLLRGAQLGAAFATWLLVLLALGGVAGASRALEARGDDRGQLIEQTVVTPDMRYRPRDGAEMAPRRAGRPVASRSEPSGRWSAGRFATSRRFATIRLPAASPLPRLLADPPVQVRPGHEDASARSSGTRQTGRRSHFSPSHLALDGES